MTSVAYVDILTVPTRKLLANTKQERLLENFLREKHIVQSKGAWAPICYKAEKGNRCLNLRYYTRRIRGKRKAGIKKPF